MVIGNNCKEDRRIKACKKKEKQKEKRKEKRKERQKEKEEEAAIIQQLKDKAKQDALSSKKRDIVATQSQALRHNPSLLNEFMVINEKNETLKRGLPNLPYIKAFQPPKTIKGEEESSEDDCSFVTIVTAAITEEYRVLYDVEQLINKKNCQEKLLLHEVTKMVAFMSTTTKDKIEEFCTTNKERYAHDEFFNTIPQFYTHLQAYKDDIIEDTSNFINRCYRKASVTIHPDRHGEKFRQEFQDLTDARDCLVDVKLRHLYVNQMLDVVHQVGVGLVEHSHNTWVEKNRPDKVVSVTTTKRATTDQDSNKPLQLMGGISNDTPRMAEVQVESIKSRKVCIRLRVLNPIHQFYEYCQSLHVVGHCAEQNKEVTILKMDRDSIIENGWDENQYYWEDTPKSPWIRISNIIMPWHSSVWSIKWYANLQINGETIQTPFSQEYEFELLSEKQAKAQSQQDELQKTERIAMQRTGEIMAVLHKLDGPRPTRQEVDERYHLLHSVIVKGRSTERKILMLLDATGSTSIKPKSLEDLQDALEQTTMKRLELESIRNDKMKKGVLKSFKEHVATKLESDTSSEWIKTVTQEDLQESGGDSNRLFQLLIEGKGRRVVFRGGEHSLLEIDLEMLHSAANRHDLFTNKQCIVIRKRAKELQIEEEHLIKEEETKRKLKDEENILIKEEAYKSMIGKLVQIHDLKSEKHSSLNDLIGKVEGLMLTGEEEEEEEERYQVYVFNTKKTYSMKSTNVKRFYGDVVLTNPSLQEEQQQQQQDEQQTRDDVSTSTTMRQQQQRQRQQDFWFCSHCSYKNEGPNCNHLGYCKVCERPRGPLKDSWSGRVMTSSVLTSSSNQKTTPTTTTTKSKSPFQQQQQQQSSLPSYDHQQQNRLFAFEVKVPAGKLGIVIDTPHDGRQPTIYSIKKDSILASRVNVGDHLIGVDNDDTNNLTALQVSKLIFEKMSKGNDFLLLKFTRTIHKMTTNSNTGDDTSKNLSVHVETTRAVTDTTTKAPVVKSTEASPTAAPNSIAPAAPLTQPKQQSISTTNVSKTTTKRDEKQPIYITEETTTISTTTTARRRRRQQQQQNEENHVTIPVQRSMINCIQGKKGKKLVRIRNETGAKILIDEDCVDGKQGGVSIVKISGKTKKIVDSAVQMINACLPPPTTPAQLNNIPTTPTSSSLLLNTTNPPSPISKNNISPPQSDNGDLHHDIVSTPKMVLEKDTSNKNAIFSEQLTKSMQDEPSPFNAKSNITASIILPPHDVAPADCATTVSSVQQVPLSPSISVNNDHQQLLTFLETHKSCLKGAAHEFCKWLTESEDIVSLADLVEALSDDEYIRESLQPGNGKVGLKGFKRAAFKKAAISALEIESSKDGNLAETVGDMGDDNTSVAPTELYCPISHELMTVDPVVAADECTYERSAIEEWFKTSKDRIAKAENDLTANPHCERSRTVVEEGITSPLRPTMKLTNLVLISNNNVRTMARDYARTLPQAYKR